MSKQTFTGSCHCGAVRYEADIDLSAGTGRCNCSICSKLRRWGMTIQPADFRLLSGAEALSDYQFGGKVAHHRFCRHCGVHAFGDGYVEEIGGAYVSINLACLDDVDAATLIAAPLRYYDGRNNDWFSTPTETRHL